MPISQALLPEFDHEMATTRRVLERVPEGNYDWKPHEKSMTIGRLAGHVAELRGWVPVTLEREKFDMATDGAQFPSLTAGIHAVGYRLAHSSLYRNKGTDEILATYNPNEGYAAKVKGVMRQIAASE